MKEKGSNTRGDAARRASVERCIREAREAAAITRAQAEQVRGESVERRLYSQELRARLKAAADASRARVQGIKPCYRDSVSTAEHNR